MAEGDFELLAQALREARRRQGFRLTAWVFLPHHWHAILYPPYPLTVSQEKLPKRSCRLFSSICFHRTEYKAVCTATNHSKSEMATHARLPLALHRAGSGRIVAHPEVILKAAVVPYWAKRTVMTTRRKAIVGTVSAFLLFGLLSGTRSCARAEWERSRIKRGMSVADVFHALNDWDICLGTYLNPDTKKFAAFNAFRHGERYDMSAKGETSSRRVNSREELIQAIEKQMGEGQAWHIQVTYIGGYPRATFRVDFDSHGKVQKVADVVLGP